MNKQLYYRKFIAAVALALLSPLTNCRKEDKAASPYAASVRLNWIPSCSFSGEVLAAREYATVNGLSIKLEPGGPGIDPIKLVQSGVNTFGVAGADLVLVANDKGADFAVIALVSFDSPGVWLAKKTKGINTVDDVRGKRIGELPGGNMQYLYEVFLKRTGLQRGRDFVPVPIPFDLKTFIAQDDCDLRPVFVYDEPSDLTLQRIEYTLIQPKDFNIKFKGICHFTKHSTIAENPELVQRYINAVKQGWQSALSNPDRAIQALKAFDPSISSEKELLGLKNGMAYLAGYQGKPLTTDVTSWEVMAQDMVALGFLKSMPDFDRLLQMQFVAKAYAELRKD